MVAITATAITLGVSVLAVLLAALLVRPIKRLTEGARQVSAGNTDVTVDVHTRDEFRELADAFNEMTRSLKAKTELVEKKVKENEELLLSILPGSAAAKMKLGEHQISETYPEVSVLFADVTGFTELADSLPADKAVGLLNDLIDAFDEAAERQGVEKVKTIGSSYMAGCGLSVPRPDHAHRIVEFAQDLLRIVRRFAQERGSNLGVRIGIHVGPVVGGVVGRTRFLYDLWGDTVNVARGMILGGEVNTIRVTDPVHDRLRDTYTFEGPVSLDVGCKARMNVWTVLGATQAPSASAGTQQRPGEQTPATAKR
jgi:class 3 adenylate cyclase